MRLILRAAQRYAEDFPDNEKPNLIFFGAAGLGKTFVADCIAQRIMERAYLVRRVTAYRLCEIMRKNQFCRQRGARRGGRDGLRPALY